MKEGAVDRVDHSHTRVAHGHQIYCSILGRSRNRDAHDRRICYSMEEAREVEATNRVDRSHTLVARGRRTCYSILGLPDSPVARGPRTCRNSLQDWLVLQELHQQVQLKLQPCMIC
jgi:hypothetical protein